MERLVLVVLRASLSLLEAVLGLKLGLAGEGGPGEEAKGRPVSRLCLMLAVAERCVTWHLRAVTYSFAGTLNLNALI